MGSEMCIRDRKGPQGTLYGRNATGGAINIINRRPTQEFEGYISGSYGDYDMVDVQGAVSGGLSANTAGRLAISYKNQGESFHDNRLTGTDFGDLESLSGRATLSFEASDTFRGDLSIHFGNVEGTNTPFSIYGLWTRVTLLSYVHRRRTISLIMRSVRTCLVFRRLPTATPIPTPLTRTKPPNTFSTPITPGVYCASNGIWAIGT